MNKGEVVILIMVIVMLLAIICGFFAFVIGYYWVIAKLFLLVLSAITDAVIAVIHAAHG